MNETKNNLNETDLLDKEIEFKEIVELVWNAKKILLSVSLITVIFSSLYALSIDDYYRSKAILVPSENQDMGFMSQYSGLASLAGVSLPSSGGNKVAEIIEIIQSREFVKHLLEFDNVLPSLMAVESFDKDSLQLTYNKDLYDSSTKEWTQNEDLEISNKPSYLKVHEKYKDDVLTIDKDSRTGLISISVKHPSPIFAKYFLSLIIKEANNLTRSNDIESSSKAIEYLEAELSQTSLIQMKDSINQLIKSQLETRMLANVNEDYSLAMIDPPFIPEMKEGPNRKMIVLIWTFAAIFLSLIVIVIQGFIKRN